MTGDGTMKAFEVFLLERESDIALGMENFGLLRELFRKTFNRKPEG